MPAKSTSASGFDVLSTTSLETKIKQLTEEFHLRLIMFVPDGNSGFRMYLEQKGDIPNQFKQSVQSIIGTQSPLQIMQMSRSDMYAGADY